MRQTVFRFCAVVYRTGLIALWTLSVGCDSVPGSLPTGPSTLTTGAVIYLDANFQGASAHVTRDISNLGNVSGGPRACGYRSESNDDSYYTWDDCISSIRLAPGWRVTLYEHPNFRGTSLELTEHAANLQLEKGPCADDDWNDCASSIRVRMR